MINFNNGTITFNSHWLKPTNGPVPPVDPYNPLGLPPYTMRLKYRQGDTPTPRQSVPAETYTLVDAEENIWDYKYENPNWSYALTNQRVSQGTSLIAVLGANTTGVTNMSYLFTYDEELTICNIFDTSNVTEMINMFTVCTALTSVPLFDTSSVTDMTYMFRSCQSLTNVPLFDTSNVISMFGTFNGCYSLTSVPLFDTSKLERMDEMFMNCIALTSVPLFNTVNVKYMLNAFNNCSSLTSIPLFDTSKVTDMFRMFYECTNVQSGALALYQQASTQTTPPTSHNQTFYNCGSNTTTGSSELAQIPSGWK